MKTFLIFISIFLHGLSGENSRRISISYDSQPITSEHEVYTGPTRYGKEVVSFGTIIDFSLGDHCTLIVDYNIGHFSNGWFNENFFICGMGWNQHGIYGNGTTEDETSPTRLVDGDIRKVSAGYFHSMFLDGTGSLWTTGRNMFGELGDGTYQNRTEPVKVDSNVSEISAGISHSIFLKTDGSLWAMGSNEKGQLGKGTLSNQVHPAKVVFSEVKEIDAGAWHNVFVLKDGSLWAFGSNEKGELGDGTTIMRASPVKIIAKDVVAANAGFRSTVFIKTDGSLWGMGSNDRGQLGDGTTQDKHVPIKIVDSGVLDASVGSDHIMFIKEGGSLWGIGGNQKGQLGLGHVIDQKKPVKVVDANVTRVIAGHNFNSAYMLSDGSLWCMGSNAYGKLGLGDKEKTTTPTRLSDSDSWFYHYNITLNNPLEGSVEGGGAIRKYVRSYLRAKPKDGYLFKSWSKDVNSTLNPLNLKVSQDINVDVNFEKDLRDTDGDGLSNYEEAVVFETNPRSVDTDEDGFSDKKEIERSMDPKTSDHEIIDDVMEMKGIKPDLMTPFVNGWYFIPSMGWLWTDDATFPYIYEANSKSWMYFQTGNQKPKFFHYGTQKWFSQND